MPLGEWGTSTIQALADAFLSSPRYVNRNTRRGYADNPDTGGSLQIVTARQSRCTRYPLLSRVITESGAPTLFAKPEGNTASGAIASRWRAPRGQRTMACTEPPCARTGRSRARPSGRSPGGPLRERRGGTPEMHERGKSGNLVVPAKPPDKAGGPVAEVVEGRRLAEGNTVS